MAGDQGSLQGHQCSQTLLTGEPGKFGCIPGMRSAAPLGGKQTVDHWTNETVYWSEASEPQQYTGKMLKVRNYYVQLFILRT
jgi:hypothetical protein